MIKQFFNENPKATITPWFKHSSSFIKAIRYDKRAGTLFVQITKIYEYQIPLDLADEFSRSSSWGRFYDTRIKEKHAAKETTKVSKPITKTAIMPVSPKGQPVLPQSIKSVSPSDSAWKDVAEIAWGVADIAALAIAPSLKPIASIITYAAKFGIDKYLESTSLEKPYALGVVEDLMVGYGIYKEMGPITYRMTQTAAALKTPYFNIGYKQGELIAKATPMQVSMGVSMGAKSWKNLIFEKDIEVMMASAARQTYVEDISKLYNYKAAIPIPGVSPLSNTIVDQTMAQAMRANATFKAQWATRKIGGTEKALDFTIKYAKHIPLITAGIYSGYEIYGDLPKKKPKKPKKVTFTIAQDGITIASTIRDMSKAVNK